uniref:(northern house mosquito) hypothetical protein n=1 Tax=Culex pipiens TaxID=7175 RepID=A0A8D8BTC6_CULPI
MDACLVGFPIRPSVINGNSTNHTPGSRGRMHHHHHVSCGWLLQCVVARRPLHNHKREWKKVWRKIAHNFFFLQLLFIVVSTLGGFICSFSPGFMWWFEIFQPSSFV